MPPIDPDLRASRLRRFTPGGEIGFFLAIAAWIAMKMAVSFEAEFPRLSLLCKWDCGWYESIARQGYVSPIPPLHQNSEDSNVAFFPAYPGLGRLLSDTLGIGLTSALPLVSILCAILVSIAIAKLLREEGALSRWIRYAVLFAYPATFYLFVSYSESLYLAAMLGGTALLLSRRSLPIAIGGLLLGGLFLGGTRLTGFVVPSFLGFGALLFALRDRKRGGLFAGLASDDLIPRATLFLGGALAATASFFLYCAVRFGEWNLYFQQLRIGWYKEFSPVKALHLFLHPASPFKLGYDLLQTDSRRLSWIVVSTLVLVTTYAGIRAVGSAIRAYREGRRNEFMKCFLAFAAIAHFYIVVCGDVGPWDAWGNGLRYPMPTVFLLAIAWRDEWVPGWIRGRAWTRGLAIAVGVIVLGFLFAHQVGYLGRFIRNEWVS